MQSSNTTLKLYDLFCVVHCFQAKHLQFVSGVDVVSYWFATYTWDFINYLVPALGILILFAAFQVESYKDELGIVFLMLVSTNTIRPQYWNIAVRYTTQNITTLRHIRAIYTRKNKTRLK